MVCRGCALSASHPCAAHILGLALLVSLCVCACMHTCLLVQPCRISLCVTLQRHWVGFLRLGCCSTIMVRAWPIWPRGGLGLCRGVVLGLMLGFMPRGCPVRPRNT